MSLSNQYNDHGGTMDVKLISQSKKRLLESSIDIATQNALKISYQHTVLCQTCLPYRDPGDDIRSYQKSQGNIQLSVEAGQAINPLTGRFEEVGLPYGSKPRLILTYLNTQAVLTRSPVINTADSLTAFIRSLGLTTDGRTIKTFKDQLVRVANAIIRLGWMEFDHKPVQMNLQIITAFSLLITKNGRVAFPEHIKLSEDYFLSLINHAIPLDNRAIAALSHNAMALDVYSWLAQRLHRVNDSQFITWNALKDQFGQNYSRMTDFRRNFLKVLWIVRTQYPKMHVDIESNNGVILRRSAPPIPKNIQNPF